jgi:hypothetical protein
MVRSSGGLPKISPGPAMPNLATHCGRATPKTPLQPFSGWPTHKVGDLRPSSYLLDTPRCMPMDNSVVMISDVKTITTTYLDAWFLGVILAPWG